MEKTLHLVLYLSINEANVLSNASLPLFTDGASNQLSL